MNTYNDPLLDVFYRLRDFHKFPLGISDYLDVISCLQSGIGVENIKDLQQLCVMLWTKSDKEAASLREIFSQVIGSSSFSSAQNTNQDNDNYEVTSNQRSEQLQNSNEPSLEREYTINEYPEKHISTTPSVQNTLGKDFSNTQEVDKFVETKTDSFSLGQDDTIQVVQAIRGRKQKDFDINSTHFQHQITDYYLPVNQRQMKQSWRSLSRKVRDGSFLEFDLIATIEKIASNGFFLSPVFIPQRSNRTNLVLFIDRGGSMSPFHSISDNLINTAKGDSHLNTTEVFYFHDYPEFFLYHDPIRLEAKILHDVLSSFSEQTCVLIVGDAGAARGYLDLERTKRTRVFIQQIQQFASSYAWINPLPQSRWTNTTASEVARYIPMFEMSVSGLNATIRKLSSR